MFPPSPLLIPECELGLVPAVSGSSVILPPLSPYIEALGAVLAGNVKSSIPF